MVRVLKKNGRFASVLAVLMIIGSIITGWVLVQQRLSLPFQDVYHVKAEFEQTSGLLPGLGQAVNVAGVKVGTIAGVKLRNGRALADFEIKRGKLAKVYANAHVQMVPNSPVKDLVVELVPGRPPAAALPDDGVIPVARTTSQLELDELWSVLDTDTRQYFSALVAELGRGTAGRVADTRRLLKTLGPTAEDFQPLMRALAGRRLELRRLVHSLGVDSRAAGSKDRQLAALVVDTNTTLQALGGQDRALRTAISRLPGTLSAAKTSLGNTATFSDQLGPTMRALLPTARRLPSGLKAARPLLDTAEPVLRTQLRPVITAALPLTKSLGPTVKKLDAVTPSLTDAFRVLVYVANELGYNPPGDNEGYLYWMAWFMHNTNSFLSTEDANGSMWRGLLVADCATVAKSPLVGSLLTTLIGPVPGC